MPTLDAFCETATGPNVLDTTIVCPDATSQRFIQERLPLAQVLRRDEWLRLGEEKPDAWVVIVERHAFLQTIIQSLRASGSFQLQETTTESLSFTELFFQFFDELVSAGVWSGDTWDLLFQRLPKHSLQSDLHLLCRVVWEKRAIMRYPTDALCLFERLQTRPDTKRLVFAGFHRLTALEKELRKVYGTTLDVETITNTQHIPDRLKIRRFEHFTDEVEWTFSMVERTARKPGQRIGIIAPPHPHYISKLSSMFPPSASQLGDEEQLSLLEALIAVQSAEPGVDAWHLLTQHPLIERLRISPTKLREALSPLENAMSALQSLEHLLGQTRTDDSSARTLYQRLTCFRKFTAHCMEGPGFWKRVLHFLRQRSQHRLPPAICLPNQSTVELLDYRCAQFSSYDLHFFPGLSQGIYPPKLPEHALLDESTREFLSKGVEALPVLTRTERLDDEFHFFRTNLFLRGRPSVLSFANETPDGPHSTPSIFLKKLSVPVDTRARIRTGDDDRTELSNWGFTSRTISKTFPLTSGRCVRATAVESYAKCPYQFLLTTVLRFRDEELETDFSRRLVGTIIHGWLEALTKNSTLTIEETSPDWLLNLIKEQLPEELRRDENQLLFFAHALHSHWQPLIRREMDRMRADGRTVFKAEHVFAPLELAHGFTISGRVDRIDEVDGNLVVVDYKTSKSKKVRTEDRNGSGTILQPFLYPMALSKEFSRSVQSSELVFLNDDAPVESFQPMDLSERLHQMAEDWKDGKFFPTPHRKDDCRYCAYQTGCSVGSLGERST